MRIFNLFIIMNVIICLGGLCNTPVSFADNTDESTESCHAMNPSAHAEQSLNIEQDHNPNTEIKSSCCNEYLTNSSSDQNIEVNYSSELKYPLHLISTNESSTLKNRSHREHDPPDLQVLHSTFLI